MKIYSVPPLGGIKKKGDATKRLKSKATDSGNRLEDYFGLQRRENDAAKIIQTAWRRTRILLPWRFAVRAVMAVVTIQRRARGMIARSLVARWFFLRNNFATELQARTRRYLSNKHVRPVLVMERQMVIRIQRTARGMIARRRVFRVLRDLAATRIQALWRGCVDRSRADRNWLQRTVIKIQNAARRKLALRHFQAEKDRLTQASVTIQRKFRTYKAAISIGDRLFQREMNYRYSYIKMLVAEEELCNEKIARIMDRVVKTQAKEKAVAAQKALQKQEEVIYGMENDLAELIHQRETLSPRAIEQGFHEELDRNIVEYRNNVTHAKMKHMFERQRDMHRLDLVLEHQVSELEEWAALRNRVQKWCAQEYDDRRHVSYQRDITARRKEKRLAVAEERRRWQVLFYTRDGKPDKRRRPGRPWDPTVFAGAERAIYSGAVGVDLLAFVRDQTGSGQQQQPGQQKMKKSKSAKGMGLGSGPNPIVESVQRTVDQVSLQTYLDEVKVYEQLLNPISDILEKNTGLAPGGIAPEDAGWGPEGAKLTEAMAGLGVDATRKKRFGLGGVDTGSRAASAKGMASSSSAPGTASSLSHDYVRVRPSTQNPQESGFEPTSSQQQRMMGLEPGSTMSRQPSASLHGDQGGNVGLSDNDYVDDDNVDAAATLQDVLRKRRSRLHKRPQKRYLPSEESFASSFRPKPQVVLDPPEQLLDDEGGIHVGILGGVDKKKKDGDQALSRISSNSSGLHLIGAKSTSSLPSKPMQMQLSPRLQLSSSTAAVSSSLSLLSQSASSHALLPTNSGGTQSISSGITSGFNEIQAPVRRHLLSGGNMLPAMTAEQRQADLERSNQLHQRRREKKAQSRRTGIIPWELLDEVDGARFRFENEKSYVAFNKKF